MDCVDHRDRSRARQRGFAMVDPAGVGTSSLVGRYGDVVSLSACHHAARAEAIHLLPVLAAELCPRYRFACRHVRANGLGNLEMAASLDFFHFQQIGWK